MEWTPESDPDAVYSRASIPLADRVGGFVVNPLVNPEAKLMLCSLANADHDNTSAQGNESFLSYAFNYWAVYQFLCILVRFGRGLGVLSHR